jgi:endonuclease YncB( thermonuclease family)
MDTTEISENSVVVDNNSIVLQSVTGTTKTKKRRLSQYNPKSIPDVPFKNKMVKVYIYNVYDGDSVSMIMDLLESDQNVVVPFKIALRLDGIDTPEITAGADRLPEEKIAAIVARDYLKSLVLGYANVIIHSWDKYGGRVLGDIILSNGKLASKTLISGGYGRPYHGEKKKSWTFEELTSAPFKKIS